MKTNWTNYRLSDFLLRQYDTVLVDNLTSYKRITIKTKGQGIELRDRAEGLDIGTKNQYRVKTNQFLLSKIDAMNGAFGIVPETCNEGIITGNFWVYDINEKLIDREYLRLLCRKQVFTNFSLAASEGTTNRRYLREDKFLGLEILLPPLHEQKQIANQIETVNQKLLKIGVLREEQSKDIKNLLYSKYSEIIEGADWLEMEVVAPMDRRPVKIELNQTYQELGTRSFFKGVFEKESFKGSDLTWEKPHWMRTGDLVFSNIKGWEGSVALISDKHDGWVASHRYITCLPNQELIKSEFLLYFFMTPDGMDILSNVSPGSADRNRTLNTKKLMQTKVPVPDLPLQEEFVRLAHKIEALRHHHKQADKQLSELMPSLLDKAFKGEL